MPQGVLIALEGGEGSGKDTLVARLKETLDPETTVYTREPGGTKEGERIRALLLDPESDLGAEEELLLFVTARMALVRTVIRPALAANKTVISNRFGLSTMAYQIYGRNQHHLRDFLLELSQRALGDLQPHYLLLDISPEIGLQRVADRNDGLTRFDAEKHAFHERVRIGYLNHFQDSGYGVCIDASQAANVVFEVALRTIRQWQS